MAEDAVTDTGTSVADGANEGATEATINVDNNGAATDTNTEQDVEQQGAEETPVTQDVSELDFSSIKLPEGVSVSDEDRANFAETAKKFGFKNQEGLQNFVDWIYETAAQGQAQMQKHSEEQAAASQKEWEEIKSGWKVSLEKDADFGKDYDMNIKRANDAMSRFGGSELTNWLKEADLIEHPALIKAFARIGKEVEDAKLLKGEKSAETTKRPVDRYNQPMFVYND